MIEAAQNIAPKVGDRVTFDSDEGIQAGTVNALRRDLGNGELHAWVEVDHQWPGIFRAIPVSALSACGPFRLTGISAVMTARLARAERALLRAGFTDCGGQEWKPPLGQAPIFIIDTEEVANAYQSGLGDARGGEHELFANENHPLVGVEGGTPLCRFHFYVDGGDDSVGEPARAYWTLSPDQSGTELAQILAAAGHRYGA